MSPEKIDEIWRKGLKIKGMDPSFIRKDVCGAIILRQLFGDEKSDFGWNIDYIYPLAKGGDENMTNLRPMNVRNIASKGDDYPVYFGAVKADGNVNKPNNTQYRVSEEIQKKLADLYGFSN